MMSILKPDRTVPHILEQLNCIYLLVNDQIFDLSTETINDCEVFGCLYSALF